MANRAKNDNAILITAVLAGIAGFCIASICRKEKKEESPIEALGDAVIQIGEILNRKETSKIPGAHTIGKKIHRHEGVIKDAMELISTGIHLWEKFRKQV
jgi:hypothetical protein